MPRAIQLRTVRKVAREIGAPLRPGEPVPERVMVEVERRRAAAAALRQADRERRRTDRLAAAVKSFPEVPDYREPEPIVASEPESLSDLSALMADMAEIDALLAEYG